MLTEIARHLVSHRHIKTAVTPRNRTTRANFETFPIYRDTTEHHNVKHPNIVLMLIFTFMEIAFLIWPVLLLPVLFAWLTRSDRRGLLATWRSSDTPPTAVTPAQKVLVHSHAYCQEAQDSYQQIQALELTEKYSSTLYYRQTAQAAYQQIQDMVLDSDPVSATHQTIAKRTITQVPKANANPTTRSATDNPLIRLR